MISFRVGEEDSGRRVDVVVTRVSGQPRPAVQAALRAGEVTVGGRVVRPSYRLRSDDHVRGRVVAPEAAPPEAEDVPVAVRYADERVLVVSKPAGQVTHPAPGHPAGTLVNALLAQAGPLAGRDTDRPGLVHRLDKDTSGLLLIARDDDMLAYLQAALRARRVSRAYLALVRGAVGSPSGSVEAPVGRHPSRATLRAVVSGGKPAVTHYSRLGVSEGGTLLEVRLETGRTHQIRVHLSYIGHPVLGDRPYGGATEEAAALGLVRPFLHAHQLSWPQPDGCQVTVRDDLPPDLAQALALAGIDPPSA